jgi:hypothetical protein
MRAKSNSPSPAQRQVQADAPKSKFLSVGNQREDTLWDREDRQKFLSALGEASAVSRLLLFPLYRERGEFHLSFDIGCPFPNMVYFCKCTHEIGPRFSIENTNSNKQREGNSNEEIDRRVHYDSSAGRRSWLACTAGVHKELWRRGVATETSYGYGVRTRRGWLSSH